MFKSFVQLVNNVANRQSILCLVPIPSQIASGPELAPPAHTGFLDRHILTPIVHILRVGCTPRRLAWSIAIGVVIGINPLLGSTTVLALGAALLLRLNLVASQLAAHVCYPLEILLFFVFIRVGDSVFHTGRIPLHREALLYSVRHHPWQTTRLLWTWEWHALLIWAGLAIVLAPAIATVLLPILSRLREPDPA